MAFLGIFLKLKRIKFVNDKMNIKFPKLQKACYNDRLFALMTSLFLFWFLPKIQIYILLGLPTQSFVAMILVFDFNKF